MRVFFQQRMHAHQKNIQRYLKYIFNDHFALLMTFLLGAAGLSYSNWLKSLDSSFVYGKWLLIVLWAFAVTVGRFASLTQLADQVFLLPKETQMRPYLTSARRYSSVLPLGIGILIIGAGMPLYVVLTKQPFTMFFVFLLQFLFLKSSHLYLQQLTFFQETKQLQQGMTAFFWLINGISWLLALFWTPFVGLAVSGVGWLVMVQLTWRKLHMPLDWEMLIAMEQKRLYRMYRFINLFTDVPQITATVKRRKYADLLLRWIPAQQQETYTYLYMRRLLRGSEYSGLVVRLLLLGVIALWFVQVWWGALVVGVVGLYLIGFQLLPLAQQYQYQPLTQLYPIKRDVQLKSFQKVVGLVLLFVTLVFAVVGSMKQVSMMHTFFFWIGLLSFDGLFCYAYLPMRLKRL